MIYKRLSNYQRFQEPRFTRDVKKAIEGQSYDKVNNNDYLNGFLVNLIGIQLYSKATDISFRALKEVGVL